MSEDGKSTITEVRDAWNKTRNLLKKTETQIEQKTGAVVRTVVTDLCAFTAGALHEAFGKMNERTGVKQIRVGGVNVGLLGQIAGLGGELLEAGGKNSEWIGCAGNGVGAQFAGDEGRGFTRAIQKQRAETDAAKKVAEAKAVAELAAKTAADKAAADKAAAEKAAA